MVLIIAEAGVNHNGSLILAKELVDVAKDCGADIVKFQSFKSNNLVIRNLKDAPFESICKFWSSSLVNLLFSVKPFIKFLTFLIFKELSLSKHHALMTIAIS